MELIKVSVEEFSRIQTYMQLVEKASIAYETMKIRYIELKVILSYLGVNTSKLDNINE